MAEDPHFDEKIEIERGFYRVLTAASKVMLERLGGEARINFIDLDEGDNRKCEIRFVGDKDKPDWQTAYWAFRLIDGEPPELPVKINEEDTTREV